jgi:hypothetical protein
MYLKLGVFLNEIHNYCGHFINLNIYDLETSSEICGYAFTKSQLIFVTIHKMDAGSRSLGNKFIFERQTGPNCFCRVVKFCLLTLKDRIV